jgi:hypothetical protein
MDFKKIFKPSKGIITLFLVVFLLMFYFILSFFSSCKVGGIACRIDVEPESLCEQRNKDFRRNCEIYIDTLAVIFLVISYIISSQIVYTFGGTKFGKFISSYFWKLISLTFIFLALSFLYYYEPLVMDAYILQRGWPLPYWEYSKSTWDYKGPNGVSYFLYHNLLLDFIFWYLVSALIFFVWNKYSTKGPHSKKEESF